MQAYMEDIIATRRSGVSAYGHSLMEVVPEQKADLFSNLIEANESHGEPLENGLVWDSESAEYVPVGDDESKASQNLQNEIEHTKLNDAELMGQFK